MLYFVSLINQNDMNLEDQYHYLMEDAEAEQHHQLTEEQLYTQYNEQPNTDQQANGIFAAEDAGGYPF